MASAMEGIAITLADMKASGGRNQMKKLSDTLNHGLPPVTAKEGEKDINAAEYRSKMATIIAGSGIQDLSKYDAECKRALLSKSMIAEVRSKYQNDPSSDYLLYKAAFQLMPNKNVLAGDGFMNDAGVLDYFLGNRDLPKELEAKFGIFSSLSVDEVATKHTNLPGFEAIKAMKDMISGYLDLYLVRNSKAYYLHPKYSMRRKCLDILFKYSSLFKFYESRDNTIINSTLWRIKRSSQKKKRYSKDKSRGYAMKGLLGKFKYGYGSRKAPWKSYKSSYGKKGSFRLKGYSRY